jgi:hypothetical protein
MIMTEKYKVEWVDESFDTDEWWSRNYGTKERADKAILKRAHEGHAVRVSIADGREEI